MEKIRLNNGTTLSVPPMKFNKDENYFKAYVITDLNYLELEAILEVNENIEKIQYLSDNDEVLVTYNGCIKYTELKKVKDVYEDENGSHDGYYIVISCDEIKAKINNMEKEIENLKAENKALKQENATLKELVDTLVVSALEV